ncbi:hypothetical protein HGRIS_007834 [Hohenbuehelia grisea]|uniref:N-alpha-acetyltransferase 40 n=1 Tax=Hohenbuehelia grisea TaxID=104357 RepID=A0ABR3J638_9AGAR
MGLSTGSKVIIAANKATPEELALALPARELTVNGTRYRLDVKLSKELLPHTRDAIWNILVTNMRDLRVYKASSLKWKPAAKKKEIFNRLSRFVLVFSEEEDAERLVAYTIFRFEHEDDFDILYCYELQVLQEAQRRGLGKVLMEQLVSVSKTWKIGKINLTVFLSNPGALKFYKTFGFVLDETSPGYGGEENEDDYEILAMPTS